MLRFLMWPDHRRVSWDKTGLTIGNEYEFIGELPKMDKLMYRIWTVKGNNIPYHFSLEEFESAFELTTVRLTRNAELDTST